LFPPVSQNLAGRCQLKEIDALKVPAMGGGDLEQRKPSSRNCSARVVLPDPGAPSRR